MTDLSRDELDDLLGAWALDAVDDDERAAIEAGLVRHPDLAEAARALREGVLALDGADTPRTTDSADVLAAARAGRAPGMDVGLADGGRGAHRGAGRGARRRLGPAGRRVSLVRA